MISFYFNVNIFFFLLKFVDDIFIIFFDLSLSLYSFR